MALMGPLFCGADFLGGGLFPQAKSTKKLPLALSPARQPAGSFLSFRTFAPPSTTSRVRGSNQALHGIGDHNAAIFFLPCFQSRIPT